MMFLLCRGIAYEVLPLFCVLKPFFDQTKAPPRDAVQSAEDIAHESCFDQNPRRKAV